MAAMLVSHSIKDAVAQRSLLGLAQELKPRNVQSSKGPLPSRILNSYAVLKHTGKVPFGLHNK